MLQSRFVKVLVLSSGQALTALVGIVSAAVLSRVFSQIDYATYRQTLLAYTFAVPFVTLGFDRALYYFLPSEESRSRGILIENLVWLIGGGALLSLFLLFGGNRLLAMRFNNPNLVTPLLYLIPYPLLMLPASAMSACLMACNRTSQVAVFNVASRLLMLITIVIPCIIWPSIYVAIIGTVIGAVLTTIFALTLMFRSCNIGSWYPTIAGLRSQLKFSAPLGFATLVGSVSQSLDQVLVAMVCSTAVFAVYVNGAIEVPLISMVTGSMTSVLIVDYAKFYREGSLSEIIGLIHRAMVKSALIIFPAMVFLMCMAPELMCLLFGAPYKESAVPFRIYLLMLPVRIFTYGAVLNATGHSKAVFIQSVLSFTTNALFLWCAIHFIGPLLAPIGPVISLYLIIMPYLIITLRKVLQCSVATLFPWVELAKVMGVSCLAVPILLIFKYFGNGLPLSIIFVIATIIYGGITVCALFVFGLSDFVPWRVWIKKIKIV